MNAKKLSLALAAALLLSSAPYIAQASEQAPDNIRPRVRGEENWHRPMPRLSAEQKETLAKLREEHRTEMGQLREKLMRKKMELKALSPNPNVKPDELKALVAEIIDLKKQIRGKNGEHLKKLRDAGLPAPFFKSGDRPEGPRDRHGFHGRMKRNDNCYPHGHPDCASRCERPRCDRFR